MRYCLRNFICLFGFAIITTLSGCTTPRLYTNYPIVGYKGWISPQILRMTEISQTSFMACITDAFRQGLSIKLAIELCQTQLLNDAEQGFGADVPGGFGGRIDAFNPTDITAACGQTDIRYTAIPTTASPPIPYSHIDPTKAYVFESGKVEIYGAYSYGWRRSA